MAKVSTNVSIDEETKRKAQILLAEFGMDLSTAINVFLKQMIYEGAFPFAITRHGSDAVNYSEPDEDSDKDDDDY